MEAYNAASLPAWMVPFDRIISGAGAAYRSHVGIGLGCWNDPSLNNTWSTSPESAQERVAASVTAGISELAIFRLDLNANPIYPLPFWWQALTAFME